MSSAAANPLAVIKQKRQPKSYTLGEFLAREEKSQARYEYYNGQIKKVPMARAPHNEIIVNMGTALKNALKKQSQKYRVYSNSQMVYLADMNMGLYPDVLVVCEKPKFYDNNKVLITNPLLIVEVLSKSTRKYDQGDKFFTYNTLDSLQEYVLIDQYKPFVETRFRVKPNQWRFDNTEGEKATLYLESLDVKLAMADIYENVFE